MKQRLSDNYRIKMKENWTELLSQVMQFSSLREELPEFRRSALEMIGSL